MKREHSVCFYCTGALWLCSLLAGFAELFGVSVCFFGTPMHQYLAIPICLFSVLLCVFLCIRVRAAQETHGTLRVKLLCAACITLCTVTVCVTAFAAAISAVHYAGQSISPDQSYKIFYETETEDSEPIAHLYRRYSSFLVRYCNSAVLYDCAEAPANAELSWEETYCAISYVAYAADAQSTEALEPVTRKMYYASAARY
ncbi:MAG: hypothetical protein ACI4K8_00120 [Candidatus Fimenecus sp.]